MWTLYQLVEQVCARPAMFVGWPRFDLAAAFLEGYDFALQQMSVDAAPGLRVFNEWLAEKLHFPKNHAWFTELKARHPDDKAAFEQLSSLYREFKASRPGEGDHD